MRIEVFQCAKRRALRIEMRINRISTNREWRIAPGKSHNDYQGFSGRKWCGWNLALPRELIDSPGLFPFRIKSIPSENMLSMSGNLEIIRHGLDEELVILQK